MENVLPSDSKFENPERDLAVGMRDHHARKVISKGMLPVDGR